MSRITMEISLDQLKSWVLQLPPEELVILAEEIEDRAETVAMMKAAESGFTEWKEEGEDIYDARTKKR